MAAPIIKAYEIRAQNGYRSLRPYRNLQAALDKLAQLNNGYDTYPYSLVEVYVHDVGLLN